MPDFPPGAICAVDGCTSSPSEVRPSTRDLILETDEGTRVLAAGTVDEAVCALHLEAP